MTSVLFVHGTGVRRPSYDASFALVEAGLRHETERRQKAPVSLVECYWGAQGSSLHASGASIPHYDSTRALGGEPRDSDVDYAVELWGVLYDDPLYELRVLALRPQVGERPLGKQAPGAALEQLGRRFPLTDDVRDLLVRADLAATFDAAREAVTMSAAYETALAAAPPALGEDRAAIARALIAESIRRAAASADALPRAAIDRALRDDIEASLIAALDGHERRIPGWVKERLFGLVARLASASVERRRGAITDAAHPAAGDILLYQAKGDTIGDVIRARIQQLPAPRVVVAHSLGGIACVDLLVREPLDVHALVTVGSQAPFLYEIGALRSLSFGDPLPEHFPQWLNIYDNRDFLSYVGGKLFPGSVTDVNVDNGQPFPASHSAYWTNGDVWTAVGGILP